MIKTSTASTDLVPSSSERRDFLLRCMALAPLPAAMAALPAGAQPMQTGTGEHPEPAARIAIPAGQLPIELIRVQVDVAIAGRTAKTRIGLALRNPNVRILEGELQLPRQEGQSVTGFAFDIDGELRPAVPGGKAKGCQVFDSTTRAASRVTRARADGCTQRRAAGSTGCARPAMPTATRSTWTNDPRTPRAQPCFWVWQNSSSSAATQRLACADCRTWPRCRWATGTSCASWPIACCRHGRWRWLCRCSSQWYA